MDAEIYSYLKKHLNISINEENFGFNGKAMVVQIKLDNEVISEDCFTVEEDRG